MIAFSRKIDGSQLAQVLKRSAIGADGRQRGFGAVSVHPGKANAFFSARRSLRTLQTDPAKKLKNAIELVLRMQGQGDAARLPSPSQIGAVRERLAKSGKQNALEYLKRQTERTTRRFGSHGKQFTGKWTTC